MSRWYWGRPQQSSFDNTQTITQTYDGDGRSKKWHENRTSVQVYPQNTTVIETTRYLVRSSVLGGKVLTELDELGAKRMTNVYAGKGVLATQVNTPASPGPPPQPASSAVQWKHQDLVTGSDQGAELEPFGAVIPNYDPNIEEPDLGFGNYRYGADPGRPESGCAIDNLPLPCTLLSTVLRGLRISEIYVNTRMDGGWGLYLGLQYGGLLQRHDVYVDDEGDDPSVQGEDGPIRIAAATRYIYSYFELLLPPQTQCKPGKPCPQPRPTPTPRGQSPSQGGARPGRDCNKEAGLSNGDPNNPNTWNAVSSDAANLIVATANSEGVTDTALAITLRFETGFYNLNSAAPNRNVSETGRPAPITGWDYGAFHTNYKKTQYFSRVKGRGFSMADIPNAYGTLGALQFDGSVTDNAKLAARMLLANGGDEENQVKWYPGKENMPARLANYRAWGSKYRTFFECWRATGGR